MKTLLGITAILLIVIIVVLFSRNFLGKNFFANSSANSQVTIGNQTLRFEVARDEKAKEMGLSGRTSLANDAGMAFPFEKSDIYRFWMKDMNFPLDMVLMNNKRVVTIFKDVPPPKSANDQLPIYKPTEPVNLVLELNAGQADKLGIKPGDTLNISL